MDALYFRPLPLRDPDRLADVTLSASRESHGLISYREFREIQESVPAFEDVVAIGARGVTLRLQDQTLLLLIDYVSGNYFEALGVPMHLGRGLRSEDDSPQATAPVVVINNQLWKGRLGARPDIIGSTIQLNDTVCTVVGVTAPGFLSLTRGKRTDAWVTAAQAPFVRAGLRQELENPYHRWFEVVGRLTPGASMGEARAQLATLVGRWRADDALEYHDTLLAVRGYPEAYRKEAGEGAGFLALVSLVLLVACANVAGLTLARSESRRREMAVRAALGASRARLARQTLAESGVLSVGGAACGLLLGSWLMALFPALVPPGAVTYVLDVRLDLRVLAFSGVLTALATLLVGLVPAWRGARMDIVTTLKDEAVSGAQGRHYPRARDLLVVAQVAVGVVVLIAATMLVRSFAESLRVNPGFDTRKNVATFYLVPGLRGYDAARTYRFFEECRRAVSGLAAVKRASYAIRLPAQANEWGWAYDFTIPGKEPPSGERFFRIKYTMVGPDYFEVMGTRILRGRGIRETDLPEGVQVTVVSETMARSLWPGEDPIGKKILMGRDPPVARGVIGVAEDNKIAGLYERPEMYLYVPYAQHQQQFGLLLVEVDGDAEMIFGAAKKRIAEIDPALPVLDAGSFARHMELVLYEERRDAWIAAGIALLVLVLGAVGIHGVVSLVTARRTREIGTRLALGARPADALCLVLGAGLRLAMAGLAVGIAGGLAVGRLLESRLHGVSSTDLWSVLLGSAVLTAVAVLASLAPACRAARVDPIVTLRYE